MTPPLPAARAHVSVHDYLEGEQLSEVRHEYLAGQVVSMAGASDRHGLIAMALAVRLHPLARRQHCQLFLADMKVRIDERDESYFYYPDLLLTCDPSDRESPYYRRYPCLLVEVSSPATARIDRREKRFAYRLLPSLREYVVIDQDESRVDVWRYPSEVHEVYGAGDVFRLECLDAEVAVEDIYADLE